PPTRSAGSLMHTELAPAPGSTTIELAVKIWRYDAESGEKELKRYEVEAPDWVTLLDVLDVIKDQQDGSLAYRKSCRMMICGCCVSGCNARESDTEFLGPAAMAKGFRFVGDPRDHADVPRLNEYNGEHGIWDCTRCYFCNERCPKGVDPRDAIAKLGAESIKQGVDHDMGAKHAKWFVTSAKTTGWLRETELVPKTQGVVSAIKQTKFALGLARRGKVPPPVPPHVAARVDESRKLYNLVKEQGRDGALGIVQGEHALGRIEFAEQAGVKTSDPEVRPGVEPPHAEG